MIFDASSLLNLANGDVLETVLSLPNVIPRVGPQARGECASIEARLDALIAARKFFLLDDENMPAALFVSLLERYGLGAGETECLTFALQTDDIVCCDDRHARSMIARELGQERVIGTLALLVQNIREELLTVENALAAYQQMRSRGGFLPDLSIQDLMKAVKK